jgi:hypothetical protein
VEREALEWVCRAEVNNSAVLFSTHADVEDLVRKVALHEDELVEVRREWEASPSYAMPSCHAPKFQILECD